MIPRNGMATPWGQADNVTELGKGIYHVGTPSHGGLFVPEMLLPCISQRYRQWAKKWGGSEQWYEEDCCWAAVAVAFPDLFKPDDLDLAGRILASLDDRIVA